MRVRASFDISRQFAATLKSPGTGVPAPLACRAEWVHVAYGSDGRAA
jgi:hypothetical protein